MLFRSSFASVYGISLNDFELETTQVYKESIQELTYVDNRKNIYSIFVFDSSNNSGTYVKFIFSITSERYYKP